MVHHGDPNRAVNKNVVKDRFRDWVRKQRLTPMSPTETNKYFDTRLKHVDTTRMVNGNRLKLYGFVGWDVRGSGNCH